MNQRILIDARELVCGRRTGIGRFLEGLINALADNVIMKELVLAGSEGKALLEFKGRKNISLVGLPDAFLRSEMALSSLTKDGFSIYISPYPKLPLFGCYCQAVHTIHDVLDLTNPLYKRRMRQIFDKLRLRIALKRASLTWYDSFWSLEETRRYIGFVGKNPKVRYPGLDIGFGSTLKNGGSRALEQYGLHSGYILAIGNGMPHKNLGVLLKISNELPRQLVFVGVSEKNQHYWRSKYPQAKVVWFEHVPEEDLSGLIRQAFCLAHPSMAEGYGYPPLEAMACSVPAVVSKLPVLSETTGGNAISVSPWNSDHWKQAFDALEDKGTYDCQIEKGLRWVDPLKDKSIWEGYVSDILKLMRDV